MLNIGGGEIALILVVALLILGPKRLPELARGVGKFIREFRRQTDEVRSVVEREFYKMDQEIEAPPPSPLPLPPPAPALPEGPAPAIDASFASTQVLAPHPAPDPSARSVEATPPPQEDPDGKRP